MTKKKIFQLINLYIDKKISPRQLSQLSCQIEKNQQHRKIFIQYRRLNQTVSQAIDRLPTENFSAFKSKIESPSLLFYLQRSLRPFRIKPRILVFFGGTITAILVVIISAFNFFAHPEKLFLGFDSDRSMEKTLLQETSYSSLVFPVQSQQVFFEKPSLKK